MLGRPRVHLREIDSTNERAKALALGGAPHGTLVTASAQTAGRGRLGRSWVAPAGSSLLASFVVRDLGAKTELWPLAAGVAACEACEACAPVRCELKWPNDVWIGQRKVAGILVEGRPQEGWAVLGIGINVTLAPDDLPAELRETATSLAAAGGGASGAKRRPTTRALGSETVLTELCATLAPRLAASPEEVVAAWSARDALRGRAIRWDGGEGLAAGVDRTGALLVDTPDGRVELHAGEVSLARPRGP